MIRSIMQDVASLIALALFAGTVTVWAQALQG